MPAQRIHLVRHGEVNNPGGVLYGRLPNFHLSDNGKKMAELAAKELQKQGFPITAIYTSPLIRTQESAKPIEQLFGLDAKTNEDLIEPWNVCFRLKSYCVPLPLTIFKVVSIFQLSFNMQTSPFFR